MRRSRRLVRAIAAIVCTMLAGALLAIAPVNVTPAAADVGQFMWLNEDGGETATYGPNSVVSISLGAIAYACDTFFSTADVYVVAGGAPAGGATLTDSSGGVNVVFGTWGGGIIDETIAVTAPSGKLTPGTYTVVYDECQDGTFNADLDAAFENAITVEFPPGELPPIDPSVIAFKGPAAQQAASWRLMMNSYNAYLKLSAAYGYITCLAGGLISCAISQIIDKIKESAIDALMSAFGLVDPKVAAADVAEDMTRRYEGLAADPPDPLFEQLTVPEIKSPLIQPEGGDPVEDTWVEVGNITAVDEALTDALLHAVERYQGADAADDPQWALSQAQAAREYAALAADRMPLGTAALQAFRDSLTADPLEIDAASAEFGPLVERIVAVGFTAEEEAYLRSSGLSDTEIADLQATYADIPTTETPKADLLEGIDDQLAERAATAAGLDTLAADLDGIIATLQINPAVPGGLPTANAGGPYSSAAGATVALDGSASTPPGLIAYEWDLDLDGDFDDATGAAPTASAPDKGTRIVGLLVRDADGNEDTSYAVINVGDTNDPPVITPTPANPPQDLEVAVGATQEFEVAVTDADGDPTTVQWHIDGVAAGTGLTQSFGPFAADGIGTHTVRATVSDGKVTRSVDWVPTVMAIDGDSDEWHANVDCNDGDAAINPGAFEEQGNGVDDDCDPGTSDAIVNDPPIASNALVGALEDTPVEITLPAVDPENDSLTYEIVDPPATGTLGTVAGNTVTFTPALDQTGNVTFTFTASDAEFTSDPATITISITPVADLPVAADVAAVTDEDVPVEITFNGVDPDADPLTYAVVTPPATGSLGAVAGDKVTFTPPADASGTFTFTYQVSAGGDTSPPADVTIEVLPVDDPIVSADQATSTPEDTAVDLALDISDPDGDELTFAVLDDPDFGTVEIDAAGTATYTPSANFAGDDSFTWLVFDGTTASDPATVDITVTPVDDLPTADNVEATIPEDTPTKVAMVGHDPDDLLTYTIVTPPIYGTLSTVSGRRVVYTPSAEYSGPDSFTYKVTGNGVDSAVATATLTVLELNDPPVAVDESVATDNGATAVMDVLANDTDIEGDPLSVVALGIPSVGSAFMGAGGEVHYNAPVGFSGVVNVPYTIGDGAGGVASATLTVLVTEGPVESETWTNETDFTAGDSFNVEQIGPNDLTIKDEAAAFARLWVAVSTKGTVVKFDTDTNAIIGEYRIAPAGMPLNPSRTTVDLNGNVWATSRDGNSVVQIGLVENGQCEDRNDNGVIDTSTGQDDIRTWDNAGSVDSDGGVETAADECIIKYVRVSAYGTRHVAVTTDNDVWVSGFGSTNQGVFDLIDGETGAIVRTEGPVGYGGYGGLIDPNGVIWSARSMLRWDTALPLSGPNGGNWRGYGHDSYGMCIDPFGNVWNTALGGNTIYKFAPDGTLIGTYAHGTHYAQGCAADENGDIWVASSLYDTFVSRIKNDGTFVGNVAVGSGPTGIAVDANGFVWSTNYNAGTVSKIDPNGGPVGADGETPMGEVIFTSAYLGGLPYNYSDMTGSTLTGVPQSGTWTGVFDSGEAANTWAAIAWEEVTPCDSKITVRAATSEDGITYTLYEPVENGTLPTVDPGRYLKVEATLVRCSTGENAILRDLTAWTTSPLAPMAEDNQTTTPEETPVAVTLEADTQPTPGGALTYEILKAPSYGTIGAVNPDGTVEYTPGLNYNGYDSIGFRVDDGTLRSDPAYSVIEVTPLNDPPVAVGQAVDVDYGMPKVIELEASDIDGDDLSFVEVTPPAYGDLTGFPDGTVTYTPDPGYVGPDSFTFQTDDDTGGDAPGRPRATRALSNIATVTIDVGPTVPGPPIDVSAIGGNQNARVQWETPLTDGGSPITGYEVRVVGTGTSIEVGIDPLIVIFGGLENDTEYQFEVRAENAVGFGPYSEASNVTKPRPACDTDAFTDVDKDHPFCPEIKWMADNDIARGYADGSYRPVAQVTRQAMAAFVYRMAGQELGPNPTCTEKPFPDVPIDHTFCGEIQWMADEGISTGFPDGTYKPRLPITRMAMSAFLYRLTGSPRGDDPACSADEFPDVPMEHPFCGEIDWMVDSGLASGFTDGTFRPGAAITRQAMAAFLFRYNVLTGIVG